jgi:glycosyltransferase involved in cell wall biosynthesis
MKILFIHEAPGQFLELHKYLNSSGLAESWLMCAKSVFDREKNKIPNLLSFTVPPDDDKTYFYIRKTEGRVKRSFHVRKAVLDFLASHKVDLVVAHGSGGFPLHLFGEVGVPVVTYIEFPSFSAHGADPKYPMPEYSRYLDKMFEMSSYHQVIRSAMTIVPSEYAREMFPEYLRHKIVAQMEGFSIKAPDRPVHQKKEKYKIGYTARDLSSAKGFEQFVMISKAIAAARNDVEFHFCGSPKTLYSYEGAMLQAHYGTGHTKTFMDYLFEREGLHLGEDSIYKHVHFADYAKYSEFIQSMDLFLYPLQFGSANWGLFEIMFRGGVVVASDRCFLPEVIKHGETGYLCKYDDLPSWISTVNRLLDSDCERNKTSDNAVADMANRYSIAAVAERYLSIFYSAIYSSKV